MKGFDMKAPLYCTVLIGVFFGALLPASIANAQLGDLLNKEKQAGSTGGLGNLGNLGGMGGALSGESVTAGSTGNVAGILSFCIKNNYLGGNAVSSVKDRLMGKLPGGSSSSDSGYADGEKGILNSSNGKQLDLGGGGLKDKITKQVCDTILSQAKSML
jgi:hypothetical protein